jgi:hypothetical protein
VNEAVAPDGGESFHTEWTSSTTRMCITWYRVVDSVPTAACGFPVALTLLPVRP